MTEQLYFSLLAAFAAICGALVARIISYETRGRVAAALAGGYCGAGAGLAAAPPFAFLLTLLTGGSWSTSWNIESILSVLSAAVETTGLALLWGLVGGAAGGILIGTAVALFKKSRA
jgi:hypothetical protein